MTIRPAVRGLTLIEVLVVLVIMAVAITAVPSILAGVPGVRLRAAADDVTAALRALHDLAIRRGAPAEMVLNLPTRSFTTSLAGATQFFPDVVDAVTFERAAAPVRERSTRIRFFPDGSATGGRLLLRHGAQTVGVTIDWLTGRVGRS